MFHRKVLLRRTLWIRSSIIRMHRRLLCTVRCTWSCIQYIHSAYTPREQVSAYLLILDTKTFTIHKVLVSGRFHTLKIYNNTENYQLHKKDPARQYQAPPPDNLVDPDICKYDVVAENFQCCYTFFECEIFQYNPLNFYHSRVYLI